MSDKIAEKRIWIIIAIVMIVSFASGPLTGKNSNDTWKLTNPLLMGIGLPFLYAILSQSLISLEKITLPIAAGFVFLVLTGLIYDKLIVSVGLYDDELDHVIHVPIANLIFYIPCVSGAVLCLNAYERYRS